jgi:hypothetical protein
MASNAQTIPPLITVLFSAMKKRVRFYALLVTIVTFRDAKERHCVLQDLLYQVVIQLTYVLATLSAHVTVVPMS